MTERDAVSLESPFTLSGKTSIVTGGGRGIGKAIVQRLVSAGANALVCDLDQEALQDMQASEPLAKLLKQGGFRLRRGGVTVLK